MGQWLRYLGGILDVGRVEELLDAKKNLFNGDLGCLPEPGIVLNEFYTTSRGITLVHRRRSQRQTAEVQHSKYRAGYSTTRFLLCCQVLGRC